MTSISSLVCPVCTSNKLKTEPRLNFDSYPVETSVKCSDCGHAFPESAGILSTDAKSAEIGEINEN